MCLAVVVSTPVPDLRWTASPRRAEAVVLVLHGGAERSTSTVHWYDPPVLRLWPFAAAIARRGRGRIAVVRLRFARRGWNDDAAPLHDARWALQRVRAAFPGLPIGVIGHSMGGRVALQLAGDPGVVAVVGLAPWVTAADRPRGGPGTALLVIHGVDDRITSPAASAAMAARMRAQGVDATYEADPGEGHALMRHPRRHHARATEWLRQTLLAAASAPDRTS